MKLTAKQMRFVDEYLVDFNVTQAAIRAGYRAGSAHQCGWQNMKKLEIQTEISRRQKDLQRRTEVTQERVVRELARVAFADAASHVQVRLREVPCPDGTRARVPVVEVKPTAELTDDQRAAIAQIKQGANGIEVKMYDKIKALELLGRHIGMFTDKLDIKATVTENPFAGLSTDELRRLIDSG